MTDLPESYSVEQTVEKHFFYYQKKGEEYYAGQDKNILLQIDKFCAVGQIIPSMSPSFNIHKSMDFRVSSQ